MSPQKADEVYQQTLQKPPRQKPTESKIDNSSPKNNIELRQSVKELNKKAMREMQDKLMKTLERKNVEQMKAQQVVSTRNFNTKSGRLRTAGDDMFEREVNNNNNDSQSSFMNESERQRQFEKQAFKTDYFLYKNAQKPQQQEVIVPLTHYQTSPTTTQTPLGGQLIAADNVMTKLMKQRNPPDNNMLLKESAKVDEYMFDTSAVRKNRDIKGNVDKVVIKNFLVKQKKSSRNEQRSQKTRSESPTNQRTEESSVDDRIEEETLNKLLEPEVNAEAIPRTIYLTSKTSERTLDKLRDKMRANQFNHLNFNAFYGSKIGRQYYKGVIIPGYAKKGGNVVSRGGSNNSKSALKVKYSTIEPHQTSDKSLLPKTVGKKVKIPIEEEPNHNPLDIMVPYHKKMQDSEGVAAFKQSSGSAIIQQILGKNTTPKEQPPAAEEDDTTYKRWMNTQSATIGNNTAIDLGTTFLTSTALPALQNTQQKQQPSLSFSSTQHRHSTSMKEIRQLHGASSTPQQKVEIKQQQQRLKKNVSKQESYIKPQEQQVIVKSMKKILDQLEFNLANNEVSEGGARNRDELDRKERLMKITEAEHKKFKPTWKATTFQQQRQKIEHMLEKGYHLELIDQTFKGSKQEPTWPLAKSHVSKAMELAGDQDLSPNKGGSNVPKFERKQTKKEQEKFTILNGKLHIGELPTKSKFWFSASDQDYDDGDIKEPGWKKKASQQAWKAKLEKMRKQKNLAEEDVIASKMPNVSLIPSLEEQEFGQTTLTKKLLENPDIQRALGMVKQSEDMVGGIGSGLFKHVPYKPPPNFIGRNKKHIKELEQRIVSQAQEYEDFQNQNFKRNMTVSALM
ncbi:hypothetical protein FGO68_gene6828 [Halteria grandinella]|uniref:Uncharacterized protein n=1 Tax=Halteria grandinella TaxID=5974 RepID=A0A8J8P3J7_HALGN|nr:hypothetical protein FGO68_gene6828 [Halteria grandinella]